MGICGIPTDIPVRHPKAMGIYTARIRLARCMIIPAGGFPVCKEDGEDILRLLSHPPHGVHGPGQGRFIVCPTVMIRQHRFPFQIFFLCDEIHRFLRISRPAVDMITAHKSHRADTCAGIFKKRLDELGIPFFQLVQPGILTAVPGFFFFYINPCCVCPRLLRIPHRQMTAVPQDCVTICIPAVVLLFQRPQRCHIIRDIKDAPVDHRVVILLLGPAFQIRQAAFSRRVQFCRESEQHGVRIRPAHPTVFLRRGQRRADQVIPDRSRILKCAYPMMKDLMLMPWRLTLVHAGRHIQQRDHRDRDFPLRVSLNAIDFQIDLRLVNSRICPGGCLFQGDAFLSGLGASDRGASEDQEQADDTAYDGRCQTFFYCPVFLHKLYILPYDHIYQLTTCIRPATLIGIPPFLGAHLSAQAPPQITVISSLS